MGNDTTSHAGNEPEDRTDLERALDANPELAAQIEEALTNPASLVRRERPRRV